MKKLDIMFKVFSITASLVIGIISLRIQAKKKTELTEEDKSDIADKVILRLKIENQLNSGELS